MIRPANGINGKPATIVVEALVGSKNLRPELLELSTALAPPDATFHIVSPTASLPMNEACCVLREPVSEEPRDLELHVIVAPE